MRNSGTSAFQYHSRETVPAMDDDQDEPTFAERMRNAAFIVFGAAISIWWIVAQVLATGAGCWIWTC
jgi:hypothetical protein